MAGAEQTCIKCALDRCEKGTDFSTLSNTDLSVPWVPTTSPQCWVLGRSRVVCQEAPEGALRGPVTGDLGQAWRRHTASVPGRPGGRKAQPGPQSPKEMAHTVLWGSSAPSAFPTSPRGLSGPEAPTSAVPTPPCCLWKLGPRPRPPLPRPLLRLQKRSRLLRPRWPQEAQAKMLALLLIRESPELGLVILSLPKTFRIAQ